MRSASREVGEGHGPAAVIVDVDTELAGDTAEPTVGTSAGWGGETGGRDLGVEVLGDQLATQQCLDERRAAEVSGAHHEDAGDIAHRRPVAQWTRRHADHRLAGRHVADHGRAGADGGPGTDRPAGHDGGADADERTLTDVTSPASGDPGRDVGEGADPATVVDGSVGVDDHAASEVSERH